MAFTPTPYAYGGYPGPGGYYAPPMPDNLATLRQGGNFQQPGVVQPVQQPAMAQPMQPVQQAPAMQQGQPASMSGPVFVNGEAGAKGYLVAAGNTVMLIDADPDANTFWLKSADASGMPSMRAFDYTERMTAQKATTAPVQAAQAPAVEYAPLSDFNDLKARFDAIAGELDALKNKPCKCAGKKTKEDVNDG